MPNTQETRRHPNAAICPRCDFQNQMPTECLRDEWQDTPCDLCGRPYQFRAVSCPALGPDPQNGGYEIETRRPPAKGYATSDEATPPGGNVQSIRGRKGVFTIDDPWSAATTPPIPTGESYTLEQAFSIPHAHAFPDVPKHPEATPEAYSAIGPAEKVSDSHNPYRRRFEIEGDRLMLLGAASQAGQDALNKFWQDLGRDLGFVWTTVQDLGGSDLDPAGAALMFTAEVEDVLPASPVFEQWWRESRNSLPGARHEIARAAFEAGSRSAATTLARLDNGVIEIVREREVETEPPTVALMMAAMLLTGGTGAIVGGVVTALALFGRSAF